MKDKKPPVSYRLSREAKQLLEALAEKYGISQRAVIELAIREKAARAKIKAPPTQGDSS